MEPDNFQGLKSFGVPMIPIYLQRYYVPHPWFPGKLAGMNFYSSEPISGVPAGPLPLIRREPKV
jgi:hypothetical protein